jgi:dolichyl-phosphate beta-glucosyltransferase
MPRELTVIVPCFNEVHRLEKLFALIRGNLGRDWEWLLINDGSTDETHAVVEEFCGLNPEKIRLVSLPENRGKGRAVREGMLAACGRLVGYVDADLSVSPLLFDRYLNDEELRAGRRMIVGIRVKTQDGRVERLLFRHLIGRVFQTYVSNITGLTAYDTQCGFKLIAREPAQHISKLMQTEGFAFDVELILIAHYMGIHIDEVMVPWKEMGHSKVRIRHIIQMARDVLMIRKRTNQIKELVVAKHGSLASSK